jgi:hypothetical protein
MLGLLRILLMIALTAVTVSTAQHAHAGQQPEAHAAHPGHANHASEPGHEHGSDDGSMTCCPSLSLHCGAGAVLCGEMWSPVEPLALAVSRSVRDRSETVATIPEFEPPPPRP